MPDINHFAMTNWRNRRELVGIRRADRRLHMYVIGRTGMGKTSLLSNMATNDIRGGEGVCFIDPHGDAVERLRRLVPASRLAHTTYFDPADQKHPMPFNILRHDAPERRHLLVSGLISIFSRLYAPYWQHRQEHILRNAILTLLDQPQVQTMVELYRLLTDTRFRKEATARVQDPIIRTFWQHEFPRYAFSRGDGLSTLQNKFGAFLTTPLVRNIVGQPDRAIDFRALMDEGGLLLVNLSKGRLGEDNAAFFGGLLMLELQLAAMSRADVPESARRDFYLYVDEFQNFVAADGMDALLSEARKYRLCVTLAHQYLGQLDEQLRQAVLGNVGTVAAFPVGPEDAVSLERLFAPQLNRHDLVDHPARTLYVRLAIEGRISPPFFATALPPYTEP